MNCDNEAKPMVKEQPKFVDRFLRLYTSQRQSDVEIVAGEGPVQMTYQSHKLILAAGSDVFQAMFYGGLRTDAGTIYLPDMDPDAFGTVLRYFYTGSVVLRNTEEACHLLYAAKKYLLDELAEQCRTYIKRMISADTVCHVFRVVNSFDGEDDLVETCKEVQLEERGLQ